MTELFRTIAPNLGEPADVRALYYRTVTGSAQIFPDIDSVGRTSFTIAAGNEISFESYFNAFPAAYWRRWSHLDMVILRIHYSGTGRIDIHRSKTDTSRISITGRALTGCAQCEEFVLDLSPFEDGGWLWCDITAITDLDIASITWHAPRDAIMNSTGNLTIGFPTFNRPDYATATLATLASNPALVDKIDKIIVVDQGKDKISHYDTYFSVQQFWKDNLMIIDQPNYGGSGGYARILYEAVKESVSEFILFMDDDVVIEPESILRALAFAQYARTPMLVGAQMLNLQERSHLHTMGELVNRRTFMWDSASDIDYNFDFARYSMRDKSNCRGLHRRVDVDFNGWWTCLIPRQVAEEIGMPLPLFLKWDDAEFGLRAQRAGYPTATIPGIAVWHVAWTDKDDAIDWQAYFHLRNRLVVAALYHEGPIKGVIFSTVKALLKHLLCLEYSTVAVQIEAIKDFLDGPDNLFPLLDMALTKVNGIRLGFFDAQLLPSAAVLPRTSGQMTEYGKKEPKGIAAKLIILFRAIFTNLRKEREEHHRVPQANFTPLEARWYSLGLSDGVTVTAADSRGVFYRKRNRKLMFSLLLRSGWKHIQLARSFDTAKKRYRQAHKELVSVQAWERKFE